MKKLHVILFSILSIFLLSQSVYAEETTGKGSRLRKFQDDVVIEETNEPLFDETGLFLDEIEPGFFKRGWKQVVITGDTKANHVTQNGSLIHFDMPKKRETYAYIMNTREPANDMYVEAEFIIDDAYRLEYGVACRVSDDGWYEVRVQTTGDIREMGSYKIYKYDPQLKIQKGRNPYVLLHPNHEFYKTVDLKNGYGKRNTIGISCVDDVIEVYINGVKQEPIKGLTWTDNQFVQGGFGAGAMVYGDFSAAFDMSYIAAELE
ncbi:MAG: hypothetical protein IJI14_08480 [Anaerolineaceae bacterium]|nr:hypothetical protein [Anaerolineaceae bacterium]